jgi:hypothetical protein
VGRLWEQFDCIQGQVIIEIFSKISPFGFSLSLLSGKLLQRSQDLNI